MGVILTLSWGWLPADAVRTVTCPHCTERVTGRLSGDGRRIELPAHGPTPDLDCAGGWYNLKKKER